MAYDWNHYRDSYSIANAQAATSLGHQGMVRLLLKHGAAVDAKSTPKQLTPLILAAKLSGFVSLGVVRELLAGGADLNIVSTKGRNAEALARRKLSNEIILLSFLQNENGYKTKNDKPMDQPSLSRYLNLLLKDKRIGVTDKGTYFPNPT